MTISAVHNPSFPPSLPPSGPPAAPTLGGKAHSTTLPIAWGLPQDTGGSDIHSYILQLDDGAGGDMTEVYRGSEISYQMEGLTPGRTYCCRVCAISEGGQGSWSPSAKLTTPPTLSTPPLQVRLSGKVTATQAILQWGQPSDAVHITMAHACHVT